MSGVTLAEAQRVVAAALAKAEESGLVVARSMPTNMVSSVLVILPSCLAKGSCSIAHPYECGLVGPCNCPG